MLRIVTLFCLVGICYGLRQSRITVGHDDRVDVEEYPYQLSLQVDGIHSCGAVIISADWALTAAQCADSANVTAMTLRAGTSTLYSGGAVHQVAQKIVHSEYNRRTLDYDLALLRVMIQFAPGTQVAPVNLPAVGSTTAPGSLASITGWDISHGANDTLDLVTLPISSVESCELALGAIQITARMICTEVTQGKYCQREAGNPMVFQDELVGVTSWGQFCDPFFPMVGARVTDTDLRSWILVNTGM